MTNGAIALDGMATAQPTQAHNHAHDPMRRRCERITTPDDSPFAQNVRDRAKSQLRRALPCRYWIKTNPRLGGINAAYDALQMAQAFSCKAGDAMVRSADKRVKIW